MNILYIFVLDIYAAYERLTSTWTDNSIGLHIASLRTTVFTLSNAFIQVKSFGSSTHNLTNEELSVGCKLGIDTHADSSCAGRHIRILEYISGKKYNVTPFHDSYAPKTDVGMINGVVAVDNPDGSGYILELNNFLDFTSM